MSSERVELRREQETTLMTLYLHAQDNASAAPILGDRFAQGVLDRIDYDFDRLKLLRGNQPVIVSRAELIDERVRSLLERTSDAVVLHLGCGLDSRVQRLDPGPGVTWLDVDQQPVIDLRRRFYPDRDGVTTIAASVTDSAWWSDVPVGRPLIVVGEGLLMYLASDGVRTVIDNVMRQPAPARTLIFDTVAPWVRRIARWQPNMRRASTEFHSSTRDLDTAVQRHPDLTLDDDTSLVDAARDASTGPLSAFIALVDAIPAGHRAMTLQTYTAPGQCAR